MKNRETLPSTGVGQTSRSTLNPVHKLFQKEPRIIPPNNNKDHIKLLQNQLKLKGDEYHAVEAVIEKQKREEDLMDDFVNDQIREYSMRLHSANYQTIEQLENRKKILKNETSQLHNQNKIMVFEIEVQKNMITKLQANKSQIKKKILLFDDHIAKTEAKMKQRQPNLDLGDMAQVNNFKNKKPNQAIGIIQKTQDEIIAEKNQLIEEYDKKIDQLGFQIQEITRTCILEKQELIRKIEEMKEEQVQLSSKILQFKLRILKVANLEEAIHSDILNNSSLSNKTNNSEVLIDI